MQSLGMRLRQDREKQRVSLANIADATLIKTSYLEAIEADDLAALPGQYFYRAFVRQYATHLGWSPAAIDEALNAVSSKPVIEDGVPSGGVVVDPQIDALRDTLRDKPLRSPQDDGMSKSWLAFAALVIVAGGAYYAWRNFTPPGSATPAPANQASAPVTPPAPAPSAPLPSGVPSQTATPATPTQELTTSAATAEIPTSTPATPAASTKPSPGQFTVTLVAKEMTWIRITADGAKVYGGTIDPGQQRTINASSAEVIVGNAGTLDVIFNGQPLKYGDKGQVKTLLFSPDGWKFKPKPLPPTDPAASPATPAGAAE